MNPNLNAVLLRAAGSILNYSGMYGLLDKLFRNKGIYILMYHRIADVNDFYYHDDITVKKAELIKQVEFYKKKYCCITMSEAVSILKNRKKLDQDYLVVTFDDGYADNFRYGSTIFKKFAINPIVYVTANKVDTGEPIWTEKLDRLIAKANVPFLDLLVKGETISGKTDTKKRICHYSDRIKAILVSLPLQEIEEFLTSLQKMLAVVGPTIESDLLSWKEARDLIGSGWEIGGHTMNHINFAVESKDIIAGELITSHELIENATKSTVAHFAYPYGRQSGRKEVNDLVKNSFSSAVTIVEGINKCGDDLYQLKRIKIANHHNIADVRTKLLKIKLLDFMKSNIKGKFPVRN